MPAADVSPDAKYPIEIHQSYDLAGSGGRQLISAMTSAMEHWRDRPGLWIDIDDEDDMSYQHVPIDPVGQITVTFDNPIPMSPRKIDDDDDD